MLILNRVDLRIPVPHYLPTRFDPHTLLILRYQCDLQVTVPGYLLGDFAARYLILITEHLRPVTIPTRLTLPPFRRCHTGGVTFTYPHLLPNSWYIRRLDYFACSPRLELFERC